MTSTDLDPIFVKALKLLQSRSKDSYFHLKQMYDEVVAQRRYDAAVKREDDGDKSFGNGSGSSLVTSEAGMKRAVDTSQLEKLKQDLTDLSQEVQSKKVKLEPGSSVSTSSSPRADRDKERDRGQSDKSKSSETVVKEKPRERLREIEEDIFFGPSATTSSLNRAKERERQEREDREKQTSSRQKEKREATVVPTVVDSGSDTEVSDDASHDESGQTDQMQFDLDIGNLSCVICNSMSISSTNRLVECQECHSLYHQDCHKPPVTEDVNDPRFVWYCCKCAKNLKKIVVKTQKKTSKPGVSTSARDSPVSKPMKADPPQMLQPFKRPEAIKPTVVKETAEPGKGLVGLASLAKNLNSRSSTVTSSTSSLPDLPKSKSDGSITNNWPTLTKAETKSSSSTVWGSGGAFSAARSATLGKTETSSQKSGGKSAPVVSGAAKFTAAVVSSGGSVAASSTVKMSQSTLMSADKRLQNMKKKAKMAEKRTR